MSSKINLLIDRREKRRSEHFLKLIRFLSVLFLFFTLVASLGLFALNILNPIDQLQNQQQALRAQQAVSANKQSQYLLLSDRLQEAGRVLRSRVDYQSLIAKTRKQFSPSVVIESFSIDDTKAYIAGSSPSLVDINESLINMEKFSREEKRFSHLELSNLSLDVKKGVYSFALQSEK